MRLGCCVPIANYRQVAKDGYDYAELPAWEVESLTEGQLQELCRTVRRLGIPCERLNSYSRGFPAIVGTRVSTDVTRRYAVSLMEKAAVLGVKSIGIGAPLARRLPADYSLELANRQCGEFLRITAGIAASYGIDILLEAVQKNMCNYINHTEDALEMVKSLSLRNVRLVVDLYHMETMGENWRTLRNYFPWISHMHVSTVGPGISRGLYGPDDQPACQNAFRAILASGYDGTVSVEPDPAALTPEATKTALAMMRAAYRRRT